MKTYKTVVLVLSFLQLTSCGKFGVGTSDLNQVSSSCVSNVCTARLSWTAPTSHSDGTPVTETLGYNIYWGTSSGVYPNKLDNGQATQGAVSGLIPGVYYFAVTAYLVDDPRVESAYSGEAGWGQAPNFSKHELYKASEVPAAEVILK